ncbi:glycosyltransferase family 4 protein [Parathermosynechococcus lividus]
MRVLYIITDLSTGGAETMLFRLLERLDRKRYEPMVISLMSMGDIGPRITALGIPVQALNMASGWHSPLGFSRLLRQIRRARPDIVHTWLYYADLLGGLAARLAGVSTICWGIRSSNLEPDKTRWTTRAVRHLCAALSHRVPRCIFSNSKTAKQLHIALGYAARKMVVVPNGFDVSRFKPDDDARSSVRAELGLSPTTLLIGMIGRYDPLKNHAGFFSAMSMVLPYFPQVHFVLAGKGIDSGNAELMQLIEQKGLSKNTHLLGPWPRLMASLDLLASTSHAEAFPNVIGEAMASGVPCVATDVGDCAYIVGDCGRIVPAGDMTGFASAVREILNLSPAKRTALGESARAHVASLFEISAVVRQYVVRQYEVVYEYLRGNSQ